MVKYHYPGLEVLTEAVFSDESLNEEQEVVGEKILIEDMLEFERFILAIFCTADDITPTLSKFSLVAVDIKVEEMKSQDAGCGSANAAERAAFSFL